MSTQVEFDFSGRAPVSAQIGMKKARKNADEKWLAIFDACVLAAARKKPEITSDDVLVEMEALPIKPQTHTLAAIGPSMMRAAHMGIIRGTNRVNRSLRPEKHGNRQNIWESKVFVIQIQRKGPGLV